MPEELNQNVNEVVEEKEVQEAEVKEEVVKEPVKEEVKQEVPPILEEAKEEPSSNNTVVAEENKVSPAEEKPIEKVKEKKQKPAKEPVEEKAKEKYEDKKDSKDSKQFKNPLKNKKLSKTAKTRRLIIFIATVYLDLSIIVLCSKYIGYFIKGLTQIIGGQVDKAFENTRFPVSVLLLVILIIINVVSIILYKDARKLKDKRPDDLLAILEETESIDGHRIVESEYEVEEDQSGPKQVVFRNAKTIESIDINKVQSDFIAACSESGVEVDKATVRLVLASIFSSRLLIIKEENKELRDKFLQALAKYFGSGYYMTELADTVESFNDVAWYLTSQGNVATEFAKGILASRQNPDTVNITMASNVKMENVSKVFKDVLGYVKNPNVPCKLKIGNRNVDNGYRVLPKNLWFVFCVEKDAMLPSEVAKYSITLELNLKVAETIPEAKEHKVVSYPQVLDCINESYENYFIEETTWKKIDEFADYLDRRGEFFIDNRIVREMERFAAIYLALDGEQADVIDTLLCKKLLLIALPNEYKKIYEDEESLVGTAEKILGADFISNASALLKKIKMN